jgi:isoamylase
MLMAGDEMGRTQRGNNNAYCQDNEISWVDWKLGDRRRALLDFTARLARLRHREGVLREDHFFRGDRIWDSRLKDLAFFRPDGTEMPAEDWQAPDVRAFGYLLGGDTLVVPDKAGRRPVGNTLLVLMNAHHEDVVFRLPRVDWGSEWELVVDTAVAGPPRATKLGSEATLPVIARSLIVLRRPPPQPEEI